VRAWNAGCTEKKFLSDCNGFPSRSQTTQTMFFSLAQRSSLAYTSICEPIVHDNAEIYVGVHYRRQLGALTARFSSAPPRSLFSRLPDSAPGAAAQSLSAMDVAAAVLRRAVVARSVAAASDSAAAAAAGGEGAAAAAATAAAALAAADALVAAAQADFFAAAGVLRHDVLAAAGAEGEAVFAPTVPALLALRRAVAAALEVAGAWRTGVGRRAAEDRAAPAASKSQSSALRQGTAARSSWGEAAAAGVAPMRRAEASLSSLPPPPPPPARAAPLAPASPADTASTMTFKISPGVFRRA
jgi:hypothetical protein